MYLNSNYEQHKKHLVDDSHKKASQNLKSQIEYRYQNFKTTK